MLLMGSAGSRIIERLCECESEIAGSGSPRPTAALTEHSSLMAPLAVVTERSGEDFLFCLANPNLNKLIVTFKVTTCRQNLQWNTTLQ